MTEVISGANASEAMQVAARQDHFRDATIDRLDVAAHSDTAIQLPYGARTPQPGEYYASKAMTALIASTPTSELGARYGHLLGTVPDEALPGPELLAVVVGVSTEAVQNQPAVVAQHRFVGESSSELGFYRAVMIIGALGVFIPVLVFVSIVTQLGAAERHDRYQAFRLLGAPPIAIAWLSAVETAVMSILGALLGIGAYLLLNPAVANLSLIGEPFFSHDLAVPALAVVVVALALVIASSAVAFIRTARMRIGPLGAMREHVDRPVRSRRAVVVIAALVLLVGVGWARWLELIPATVAAVLVIIGFVLMIAGILLLGPWLTATAARLLARWTNRGSTLIAASRIESAPRTVFRSVSGLVLAAFIVTMFAVAASSVTNEAKPEEGAGLLPADGLIMVVDEDCDVAAVSNRIAASSAVDRVVVGYKVAGTPLSSGAVLIPAQNTAGLNLPGEANTEYVSFDRREYVASTRADAASAQSAAVPRDELRPFVIVVRTAGSPAALEETRTAMDSVAGTVMGPMTRAEVIESGTGRIAAELAVLAYLGVTVTMAIAGCSLAVSTASAMIDRRRVFGLLRLMGMPKGVLRQLVTLEAMVPLLAVLLLSVGLGVLVAWLVLDVVAQTLTIGVPDSRYFATMGVGLLCVLTALVIAFGAIQRNTRVEQTRFE